MYKIIHFVCMYALLQNDYEFVVRMLENARLHLRARYFCLSYKASPMLMYDQRHSSWASFHTFHAPRASGVIYSRGLQLLYGFFWAGINAIIACTTIANHCYEFKFAVSILLHLV